MMLEDKERVRLQILLIYILFNLITWSLHSRSSKMRSKSMLVKCEVYVCRTRRQGFDDLFALLIGPSTKSAFSLPLISPRTQLWHYQPKICVNLVSKHQNSTYDNGGVCFLLDGLRWALGRVRRRKKKHLFILLRRKMLNAHHRPSTRHTHL